MTLSRDIMAVSTFSVVLFNAPTLFPRSFHGHSAFCTADIGEASPKPQTQNPQTQNPKNPEKSSQASAIPAEGEAQRVAKDSLSAAWGCKVLGFRGFRVLRFGV